MSDAQERALERRTLTGGLDDRVRHLVTRRRVPSILTTACPEPTANCYTGCSVCRDTRRVVFTWPARLGLAAYCGDEAAKMLATLPPGIDCNAVGPAWILWWWVHELDKFWPVEALVRACGAIRQVSGWVEFSTEWSRVSFSTYLMAAADNLGRDLVLAAAQTAIVEWVLGE